MFPILRGFYRI